MKRTSLMLVLITSVLIAGSGYGQMVQKQIKITHGSGCCVAENMTEDQQKKVDALHNDLQKALTPLNADLAIKKAELNKLLIADNPNASAIDKKIDEIFYAIKSSIEKKQTQTHLDVRAILTPEQRVSFDKQRCGGGAQMMHIMKDCGSSTSDCGQPCKKKIIMHKIDGDGQDVDNMDVDVKVITE